MAHLVQEGIEGVVDTGSSSKAVDINQWLKTNGLSLLQEYFTKFEITIDDLMDFSESDMKLRVHSHPLNP